MKTCKLLKIDLYNGLCFKVRYLVFIGLSIFACYITYNMQSNLPEELSVGSLHISDYIAYIIGGSVPMKPNTEFEFSIMWFTIMVFQLLMPLDYPSGSMDLWGYPYFTHTSRTIWWRAKYFYVILVNIFTELLFLLSVLIFGFFTKMELSLKNNPKFFEAIFSMADFHREGSYTFIANIVLLIMIPLLGIMAMSLIQLFVSVFVHPVIAYMISLVWLFLSLFRIHPLLLGNLTMIIRQNRIFPVGISVKSALIVTACIIIGVYIVGLYVMKQKDIFVMRRES